jgi:hypothetical protein
MAAEGVTFCGQVVSASQLRLICESVTRYPDLSREELANTICEWLDWYRPNGRLKARECRDLLQQLHEYSIIELPALRAGRPRGSSTSVAKTAYGEAGEPLQCALSQVQPVQLRRVQQSAEHADWRELVGRYHYLGHKTPYGASIRYLIESTSAQASLPNTVLGCLQFSSPAWQMSARDSWIGWDSATRKQQLPRLINNSRFLILPWVHIPNLASHVLALALRTVADDWEKLYGLRPWLAETLVDSQRFTGHCYRAANWIDVGQTTGRGRQDKHHRRHGVSPKRIMLYPLCTKARQRLRNTNVTATTTAIFT